jgi:hypothetical protein
MAFKKIKMAKSPGRPSREILVDEHIQNEERGYKGICKRHRT